MQSYSIKVTLKLILSLHPMSVSVLLVGFGIIYDVLGCLATSCLSLVELIVAPRRASFIPCAVLLSRQLSRVVSGSTFESGSSFQFLSITDRQVIEDARRIAQEEPGSSYIPSDPKEFAGRIFHTCYMGTENSSPATRKRAKDLAEAIGRSVELVVWVYAT